MSTESRRSTLPPPRPPPNAPPETAAEAGAGAAAAPPSGPTRVRRLVRRLECRAGGKNRNGAGTPGRGKIKREEVVAGKTIRRAKGGIVSTALAGGRVGVGAGADRAVVTTDHGAIGNTETPAGRVRGVIVQGIGIGAAIGTAIIIGIGTGIRDGGEGAADEGAAAGAGAGVGRDAVIADRGEAQAVFGVEGGVGAAVEVRAWILGGEGTRRDLGLYLRARAGVGGRARSRGRGPTSKAPVEDTRLKAVQSDRLVRGPGAGGGTDLLTSRWYFQLKLILFLIYLSFKNKRLVNPISNKRLLEALLVFCRDNF